MKERPLIPAEQQVARLLSGSAAPAQRDAGEAPPKHPVGCAFAPFAARGIPRALRSRFGRPAANEV